MSEEGSQDAIPPYVHCYVVTGNRYTLLDKGPSVMEGENDK